MSTSRFINASDLGQVVIGIVVGLIIGYIIYNWVFMGLVKASICKL